MKTDKVQLANGDMVHVIEEIFGLRYSGDRFVLGVIVGHHPLSETDLEIVECELSDDSPDLFEVMVGEPREIAMTSKAFDKLVEIVTAYRADSLE